MGFAGINAFFVHRYGLYMTNTHRDRPKSWSELDIWNYLYVGARVLIMLSLLTFAIMLIEALFKKHKLAQPDIQNTLTAFD